MGIPDRPQYRLIHNDLMRWLYGNQWQAQRGYLPKYHAVLCDPPYYLGSIVKRFGADDAAPAQYGTDGVFQRSSAGFMGQTWDGFETPQAYQVWVTEWATLLLDFMYPGAVGHKMRPPCKRGNYRCLTWIVRSWRRNNVYDSTIHLRGTDTRLSPVWTPLPKD